MEDLERITLQQADDYILANTKNMIQSVIAIGYYLKRIRDLGLYQEAGYGSVWDYAYDKYGFSKSTTSRCMSQNDHFSIGGNSLEIDEKYQGFSKSQLQEMLYLDDSQMGKVDPSMTVLEIRDIRKGVTPANDGDLPGQMTIMDFPEFLPEPGKQAPRAQVGAFEALPEDLFGPVAIPQQEDSCGNSSVDPDGPREIAAGTLSAYGTKRRSYPPDSLIATEGCEGGHDCFLCAMECEARGRDRYCREAPMGKPFPCEIVKHGFEDLPDTCQFVDHALAGRYAGSGEPDPCCKSCQKPCGYMCSRGKNLRAQGESALEETVATSKQTIEPEQDYVPEAELTDLELLQKMVEKENKNLSEMIKVEKAEPHPALKQIIREKKLLVASLASMLCDLDVPTNDQPELPVMKNNDQRKSWLRNYKGWGLWYEDGNIGVRYYKYDFENGAKLIVEETADTLPDGQIYESAYFHLVGGPDPPRHPTYGYGKWSKHGAYCHHADNETELVEFLKEVQRG